MKWEDIPAVLELETDGDVWCVVELGYADRVTLAAVCTQQHQSLQTILTRALERYVRRYRREFVPRPEHGGFPERPL